VCAHLKKLVEAYQISDKDEEQYIAKGCALIRANFHIDPNNLTEEEWAMMFQQACWLERTRLVNLAKILGKLFAPQGD
jgi:hypothetical protein